MLAVLAGAAGRPVSPHELWPEHPIRNVSMGVPAFNSTVHEPWAVSEPMVLRRRLLELGRQERCWSAKSSVNLELAHESVESAQRCTMRFPTESAAKAACPSVPGCGGVTQDDGMKCPGRQRKQLFELRSARIDQFALAPKTGLSSWLMGPTRGSGGAGTSCQEFRRATSRNELASAPKGAKLLAELPGGIFTRGVARPRSRPIAWQLHNIVGGGVVFELTSTSARLTQSTKGGEKAGEAMPPVALIHQRVPASWRGVKGSREGWPLRNVSSTHLTGKFVATASDLCRSSLYPPAKSSDWVVAVESVWPAACTEFIAKTFARMATQGVVVGSKEVAHALVAANRHFAIDAVGSAAVNQAAVNQAGGRQAGGRHPKASHSNRASLLILRRTTATSAPPVPDPPPYTVIEPSRLEGARALRTLGKQVLGKQIGSFQPGDEKVWPAPKNSQWLPSLVHPDSVEMGVALAQLAVKNQVPGDHVET